ncbi:ribokinase [Lutimaribacter sp. EGI FJ00015]|uniref:Ribokinase n=1 Tax=Lutimaribacter degradans TaxID=2945989 RepID=A0ACC5ZV81_9RHOB|nr:ribokinase [Lutimaribacter sp. EGI FJ00013]MCM2561961.1 ribokinase [Lutimaribacter sp. EGI FJ00013]MCO0613007.1 ribokinase [Lutimaribacter sp. EGI FJ00015]MCO0635793.1 ribokinase [Lutimaribacter sp. EGI FJ00014]
MTIYNLGSINADHFYAVPHLPGAGETLAATALTTGLGGKGANQSVAAAQAGAEVVHMGAVGRDGAWAVDRLASYGVQTQAIAETETPTGHAVICVDPAGENQIILYPGANHALGADQLAVLDAAGSGDWLILQNETNLQAEAAKRARGQGALVAYSAAPFAVDSVRAMMPHVDLLLLNAVEARQLSRALGVAVADLPVPQIVVTKGADGAEWIGPNRGETVSVPAQEVDAVDTTGAGDTFAGYMVAGLSQSMVPGDALRLAAAAAALKVTRAGTADAIPTRVEVDAFLKI